MIQTPFTITKESDKGTAYFTVRWSRLRKADKYDIATCVPSVSGIYELYYMDKYKKLNLFFVSRSWYGGLRSSLRYMTDPELDRDPRRLAILNEFSVYYRFSLSDSSGDLDDVLFFYMATYFPADPTVEPSGRFEEIYVKEETADRIVTA
jgi:hypothetical protein